MSNMRTPNSIEARDVKSQLHSYTNISEIEKNGSMIIERGDGVYVIDVHGNKYLDGMAGLWSATLGFNVPRLAEAATRQMADLSFYHNFFGRSPRVTAELAEKLVEMTPEKLTRVYFANSGSEANDTAIKLIWYYHNAIGKSEKKKILSRQWGYHGVTVATASLTAISVNQNAFDLPIDRIEHVGCPHHYRFANDGECETEFATRLAQELEDFILAEGPDTVAALFAEPVMAAGGVFVPPETYFEKIQVVLKKYDVLLVADEVVCGFGRTGEMFGSSTFGLKPDFMTLAKGLSASALPISALMMTEKIYDAIREKSDEIGMFGHGYTYSGHPTSAAVALETLKIYEELDIAAKARERSVTFLERLHGMATHPLVGHTRGVGMIGAVELVKDKATKEPFDPSLGVGPRANNKAVEHGVILRARGDILTICPPLIISDEEVHEMFDKLIIALDLLAEELTE